MGMKVLILEKIILLKIHFLILNNNKRKITMAFKIYTKTGDKGKTALYGGDRVAKNHPRLDAYGTVDELNSQIGLAAAFIKDDELKKILIDLQIDLFDLGGDLATPLENEKIKINRINDGYIEKLETLIDKLQAVLPELKVFILPGGGIAAGQLHVARTICRRAERETVSLSENFDINEKVVVYLNRLSDLLFVLARYANFLEKISEPVWEPRKE